MLIALYCNSVITKRLTLILDTTLSNTPGTSGGPGGRDRTPALKSQKIARKSETNFGTREIPEVGQKQKTEKKEKKNTPGTAGGPGGRDPRPTGPPTVPGVLKCIFTKADFRVYFLRPAFGRGAWTNVEYLSQNSLKVFSPTHTGVLPHSGANILSCEHSEVSQHRLGKGQI